MKLIYRAILTDSPIFIEREVRMAGIKFARGKQETLDNLPLTDGQLILIEDTPEWLFDMADENKNINRYHIRDQKTIELLNSYIESTDKKIDDLENTIDDFDIDIDEITIKKNKDGKLYVTGFIPDNDKGKPNGVASLDNTGKVPEDQLPSDIGYKEFTGTKKEFEDARDSGEIQDGMIVNIIDDYVSGDNPDEVVTSVNGKTGDVELSAEDVGALPDTTEIPSVVDELTSTSTTDALSANMGNELKEKIDTINTNLSNRLERIAYVSSQKATLTYYINKFNINLVVFKSDGQYNSNYIIYMALVSLVGNYSDALHVIPIVDHHDEFAVSITQSQESLSKITVTSDSYGSTKETIAVYKLI